MRVARLLTVGLIGVLILSAAGLVVFALNPPETTDPFTEFYILGPDGNATNYPTELSPSEDAAVIVGVGNFETGTTTYQFEAKWNETTAETREIRLEREERTEFRVDLTAPAEPGEYRLQFLLYRGSDTGGEPYRDLRLFVTVSEG